MLNFNLTQALVLLIVFTIGLYLPSRDPELAAMIMEYTDPIREIIHNVTAAQ